jgi:hypothetical protein
MTVRPFERSPLGRTCDVLASGDVDLYFYDELPHGSRDRVSRHVDACRICRQALEEMGLIRQALAARPAVSAPESGDWSAFMSRLDTAVAIEARHPAAGGSHAVDVPANGRRSWTSAIAMAALLALVTLSVAFVARSRPDNDRSVAPGVERAAIHSTPSQPAGDDTRGLTLVGQQHLDRSKLVLLGLANKDAQAPGSDWNYERELASRLLVDTRLYRMAAEERGLDRLAGIMRDLELVLLQTSMAEEPDAESLEQIQRAIRKRDLLQKMDMVRTTGT